MILGRYSVRRMDGKKRTAPPVRLEGADTIRHNCRIKTYPDGSRTVLVADRAIFREPGWELASDRAAGAERQRRAWEAEMQRRDAEGFDVGELSAYQLMRHEDAEAERRADSLARAQRRAKAAVRDLAMCSGFRWFVTLTLSPEEIDRHDVAEITRRLNHWCDNHVRRNGLAYVLVPERHKDGAIHFHGLFNGAVLTEPEAVGRAAYAGQGPAPLPPMLAVDSGHRDSGGHRIYNLPAWDLGFTTAVQLYGERRQAVAYVCKYIGKQMTADGTPGKVGGRWYYSGGNLRRPEVSFADLGPEAYEEVSGYSFTVDALGARVKLVEVEGGGEVGRNRDRMAAEGRGKGPAEAVGLQQREGDAAGGPGENLAVHGGDGLRQSGRHGAPEGEGVGLRPGHPPGGAGVR